MSDYIENEEEENKCFLISSQLLPNLIMLHNENKSALSDILRNKIEIPKIDSREKKIYI